MIDGRAEIVAELAAAAPELRAYVGEILRRLLEEPSFVDALPGHLPPDAASQARLPLLVARLRELSALYEL